MTLRSKRIIRITMTIAAGVVILPLIFYPKIKPLWNKASEGGQLMPQRGAGRGNQPLFASGYVIIPVQMNEMIRSTGTLLPDEEVELTFETQGKVVGIYFDEGRRVKKGELLAKLNDAPLQAQLLKLQAQHKLTEEKVFRQKQLLDRDAISRESYDQVATELQTIEADIKLLEARISETELRAPFDGIIGLRLISEGAYATTQTPLARLVKISPLKLEFSIPERYAGDVSPGFPVKFSIDGISKEFQADVYAIDPKIEINTRTIVVRAYYPNKNEELKPGRFTSVSLLLSQIDNAVAVPSEALIPEMNGVKVFVYRNGKAEQVRVTTGLRTESQIEIKSGLKFGDTLLTTAILQLRQGIPVKLDTLIINNENLRTNL
ncbi:MAG TPA: efflux RND transporter periplasmic adaptor subunit [Bacteroidales bacterium]|nr:efflux RND transporter periplasmic adaptor subunit [Bacteroidales bacterium]HOR05212.1 efflux RND transporter periplasmic adaptor subunit [Bacteroidales bacterium]HOU35025.1 efflux RND transporter periplasmic adaptor subunit [Bacteroidales bacterium]HPL34357.1 efflux RND transporter periplasmic adaptor subunit [Bacteroidales bacterium]HQF18408.1 efflux RND transporter periplasmic adaptor subunit [Bacteroidales bacterium]